MRIKNISETIEGEHFMVVEDGILKCVCKEIPVLDTPYWRENLKHYMVLYTGAIPEAGLKDCEHPVDFEAELNKCNAESVTYLKELFDLDEYDEEEIISQMGDGVISVFCENC